MKLRSLCRLAISTTVGAGCLLGLVAPAAHADTAPGNTPSRPFAASQYSSGGCSYLPSVYLPIPIPLPDAHVLPDPAPWWGFYVNFRDACDMHDAGYAGGIVRDPVNGGVVDTRGMSRAQIDANLGRDLTTLCLRQIPWHAVVAMATCHGLAAHYYGTARGVGMWHFDADPAVPGPQLFGPRPNN